MDDAMLLGDTADVGAEAGAEVGWRPLAGGWSGESFLSSVGEQVQVVRIYTPGPGRRSDVAVVEAALARLMTGLVPVPRVVEVRPERDGSPGLLVTDHVSGIRGDDLLRGARESGRRDEFCARVGSALGAVAGALAGMPTLRRGALTAPDLVAAPDPTRTELHERATVLVPLLRGWSDDLRDRLLWVCADAQELLDMVPRTSVVHGDLHPRNAVFDAAGRLLVVVDWEHAHSGDPHTDLGSLLRFEHDPVWEDAVVQAWVERRGGEPEQTRDLARCADLVALLTLAVRPGGNLVVDLADLYLREIAAAGDWHARPQS